MQLRLRIAALAVLVALVPLVLSSLRSVQIATDEAAATSAEILVRDADALAAFVDTWVTDQAAAVGGVTQLLPIADLPPAQQEHLLSAVFLAVPTVVTAALVDADGGPIVPPRFLTTPADPASPLAGRALGSDTRAAALIENLPLTEALALRTSVARAVPGAPYRFDGRPTLPVAAVGPYGEDVVVGAEIAMDVVAEEVGLRTTATHGVVLLDAAGEPMFGGDHTLVLADDLRSDTLRSLWRTSTSFSFRLRDGTEVRGGSAPIPTLGWSVLVVEPADVAERAGAEIRRRTGWVLVLAVGLAVGLGVLVARNITEPIERLRQVALEVAEGQVGKRLYVGRTDEIGELVRAFNHMSGRLLRNRDEIAAQQAKIEQFNAELQQRVEERTRALEEAQARLVRSGQLAAVAEVGAGLAHELNNPLTAILGLSQVLRLKNPGSPDVAALASLEEQAVRCREVVSAMLRLSAQDVAPTEAPVVEVSDVLEDVLALVRSSLHQRGVTVDFARPTGSVPVRLDPAWAERAFAPLFTSLASGLDPGASLSVAAHRVGPDVVVTVTPDRPITTVDRRDAWMTTGAGLWVSRHLLSQAGFTVVPPAGGSLAWQLRIPAAEGAA
jgi:two-component system NtrC family sensor kinase